MTTKSPSKIPSSIIDLPLTLSTYEFMESRTKSVGTQIVSRLSMASIGSPAVMSPASGNMMAMGDSGSVSTTSIDLAIPCSPVLITPLSHSARMCWCTVAGDERPNSSAISLYDGV